MASQLSLKKKINTIAFSNQFWAHLECEGHWKPKIAIFNVAAGENRDFRQCLLRFSKNTIFPQISKWAKIWSKQAMTLIFFPVKAEVSYFSNLDKGGRKGGQRTTHFLWKKRCFSSFSSFFTQTHTKIGLPLAPLLAPLLQIWKILNLSFHWKKN